MKHFSIIFALVVLFVLASTSFAQINWTKDTGNPVMLPGSAWENDEVYAPCVIKDGDTLKMWYTGASSSGVDQIGYATSTDGTGWQRYAGNPVLRVGSAGSWDSQLVVSGEVIFDGTTYHMWYGGSSNPNWYDFDAGYATSQDGIHWTKYDDPSTPNPPYVESDPVLKRGDPGEWDDATLAGLSCISDGDTLRMWYAGCDGPNWVNERIGYAKSTNGIDWQKYAGNPVFDGGGAWGAVDVGVPFVIADTSGYKMWYNGSDGVYSGIGYATSSDGISWSPWSTPVLEPGAAGTWDSDYVNFCCVLLDNNLYHMWYAGATFATGYRARIGYATAPACTPGFLGDVNIDDNVNSTDGLIVLSYDAGLSIPPQYLERINMGFGDADEGGTTNSTDALIILSYDAGLTVPFPVGDPVCLPGSASRSQGLTKAGRNAGESIRISAVPTSKPITRGMSVNIPVMVDMTKSSEKLGSYTAELKWNPEVFEFISQSGGTTEGFENPVVNEKEIAKGKLKFAHAYPYGADKEVNLLNVQLKVLSEEESSSSISLNFSAMAAARTFVDLLPYLQSDVMDINLESVGIPNTYSVLQYPNPFNPTTTFEFSLPYSGFVSLKIYNILGEEVATLVSEKLAAGQYKYDWDAGRLASGMYIYRIQAGDYVDVKKIVLLR